jgi:hypothetical protein
VPEDRDEKRAPAPDLGLPADPEFFDLSVCLHDASVDRIESDRGAATMRLTLAIFFIAEHRGLPDETRFELILRGVRSARVFRDVPVPDPEPNVDPWKNAREESIGWASFENAVDASADCEFDIMEADLSKADQALTLHLSGYIAEPPRGLETTFYRVDIRAEAIEVQVGAEVIDLDTLVRWGGAYWQASRERRDQRSR